MKIKRGTALYMKVTRDKYELPLAVADSPAQLARILGLHNSGMINSAISHAIHDGRRSMYVKVVIDEEADL